MNYSFKENAFEDHSVWSEDGELIADGITFATCAKNLVFQLNNGMITPDELGMFKPERKTK